MYLYVHIQSTVLHTPIAWGKLLYLTAAASHFPLVNTTYRTSLMGGTNLIFFNSSVSQGIAHISWNPVCNSTILLLCLDLPIDLFPSGSPTKIPNALLFSPVHATCTTHLILLVHPNNI